MEAVNGGGCIIRSKKWHWVVSGEDDKEAQEGRARLRRRYHLCLACSKWASARNQIPRKRISPMTGKASNAPTAQSPTAHFSISQPSTIMRLSIFQDAAVLPWHAARQCCLCQTLLTCRYGGAACRAGRKAGKGHDAAHARCPLPGGCWRVLLRFGWIGHGLLRNDRQCARPLGSFMCVPRPLLLLLLLLLLPLCY
ncbi:hypothetical protein AOQ84DRAFT_122168 [Glonium stellatum]|uniref:Uncharacterized protein n=1 Tax=Glonium stellatum TaxID=574774 RepID=A0A8E2ESX8_9PEZI|nr:hypothetical protein AOQ84DRAFT_122168 [Glonium stellatum]